MSIALEIVGGIGIVGRVQLVMSFAVSGGNFPIFMSVVILIIIREHRTTGSTVMFALWLMG